MTTPTQIRPTTQIRATSWSDVEDRELVAEIAAGSEAALAEAFRRHASVVANLARRILRDPTLAEEVVQEVFLKLWKAPDRFDSDRGSLRSFLLTHTHGRSIDLIRSESSRRTREEREAWLTAEAGPSIDEEVWQLALAERVRIALTSIPDTEKQVIELAYFGGFTYREVATRLGLPEGTVKSRIRSGLGRLQGLMIDAGVAHA